MSKKIFRKAALEKLSTPEKLDQLIQIISPKSWLILVTIGLIFSTAIGWSVVGKVKTKLNASGILLGGEVNSVVSNTMGQLMQLKVGIGDTIQKGDVIAEVLQPEIQQQMEEAKASIQERKFELQQALAFGTEGSKLQKEFISQQKYSLDQQIKANEKNLSFQRQQLKIEQGLLDKGLITKPQIVNREQQIETILTRIEGLKAQIAKTSTQELDLSFNLEQKITLLKQKIAQEERNLEQLKEKFSLSSEVRSLYAGTVVEILSNEGMVVSQGTPLCKLKSQSSNSESLKGILYVPAQDGKRIKEGMEAFVVPATVKPQEFGYMKAKVTYVSEFSITQQGMMTTMKNDQLVQNLLKMGAPFEIYVEFEKDPETYSGYKWTSVKGPEIAINEGTFCKGRITVREEPPLQLVIPALKKFFDLY
ncbi:MAG: NHLP bacteriocin system secretion protein [Bacteroidia bacterium]|nr:NHLP bacteriocin system secretion protein [Bacteroidia bacterium]